MIVFAILLLPIMPFIHRKRRMREQVELHKRIQEATAKILEDGKIEGPKGPYAQHVLWDVGTEAGTPRDGPPPYKLLSRFSMAEMKIAQQSYTPNHRSPSAPVVGGR